MFGKSSPGRLVPIRGTTPGGEAWEHRAFVPDDLPSTSPELSGATYRCVAEARARLAALDSTALQLPDSPLFRYPTLRREAQSTSALEGTYAPLTAVLEADEDSPVSLELTEILNYVRMAERAFAAMADGSALTLELLTELQGTLMRGTRMESVSGQVRDAQVVIGLRTGVPMSAPAIETARFVPAPPGEELEQRLAALAAWMGADHTDEIDPVVAAAMAHYQFEALHPFRDGNGRLGRLLIVLHLVGQGVLTEPTLSVSPWFEERRSDYYDRLMTVSTDGDWDAYVAFFARGIAAAAELTQRQMIALRAVHENLRSTVRGSSLRAETAGTLVDLAIARPSFSVRQAQQALGVSYQRANQVVRQLVRLGVLDVVDPKAYKRRFFAPAVVDVLTGRV